MKSLVLVADAERAALFCAKDARYELTELADFIHPKAAADNPPGRAATDRSGTRHALAPRTLPRQRDMQSFATELAEQVIVRLADRGYAELVLVAPPTFLGLLRDALQRDLPKIAVHAIHRNLTRSAPADLTRALRKLHRAA